MEVEFLEPISFNLITLNDFQRTCGSVTLTLHFTVQFAKHCQVQKSDAQVRCTMHVLAFQHDGCGLSTRAAWDREQAMCNYGRPYEEGKPSGAEV